MVPTVTGCYHHPGRRSMHSPDPGGGTDPRSQKDARTHVKRVNLSRLVLVLFTVGCAGLLASCSSASDAASTTTTSPSHSGEPLRGQLPSDIRAFTRNGTWVAPRNGTYTVVTIGAGGGGGGGGSALTAAGVSDQVGGAGGAAGAVTINDVIAKAGQRFAIRVGVGGNPRHRRRANGGSGTRGGTGGTSSCQGVASADGGVGGAGSVGDSDGTVLNPVGAGNSSDGTIRSPGSGGGAGPDGGGMSGSSYLYSWPGGGGGGTASTTEGGSGGGAAGVSGTDSPGGGVGNMSGPVEERATPTASTPVAPAVAGAVAARQEESVGPADRVRAGRSSSLVRCPSHPLGSIAIWGGPSWAVRRRRPYRSTTRALTSPTPAMPASTIPWVNAAGQ